MIVLPVEEGYRFCTICQRYVSSGNQHCEICNSCTSKLGFTVIIATAVLYKATLVRRLMLAVLFVARQVTSAVPVPVSPAPEQLTKLMKSKSRKL
nr:PREDICTED: uncharacterized protein LOC104313657 isoform X5 [Haliaeetus albicilla]